jgi:flagellar FliJ protein
MNAAPPWERLKDLAARRRDAQAQRLSAATRELEEAQRRLDMLVGYRTDYQGRLAQASGRGIDLEQLRNYQAFLAQLERAIAQQAELLERAARAVQAAKAQWSSERQRVDSFQALEGRHLTVVARNQQRREQKLTDDWAARRAAHASAPDTEH